MMYFRYYFYMSSLSSHRKSFFRSLATPLTRSRSSGAPANVRNMFVIDHTTFLSLVKIASFSCQLVNFNVLIIVIVSCCLCYITVLVSVYNAAVCEINQPINNLPLL